MKSGLVCGGDEGEGLDLKGTFVYAFNVGPNGAADRSKMRERGKFTLPRH